MLGAKAMEQRVLGGYVSHVKKLHPDAPTPQVYRTDALSEDIRALQARHGDRFIVEGLTSLDGADAGDDDDEWGESFAWTSELLDTALAAEEIHESGHALNLVSPSTPAELRARLVQDASTNLLPGFTKNAAENEHGFISLDAGLSVIASHAKELGYDGLILFLDELILWLATLIHDQKFVGREAGKITNFVEGADARRAIPVVSFIARQRDLRELVGEELSGAAEASVQDTLNQASGRFDKITLEDRNLPQIARARLLQPKSTEAAALIEGEFLKTRKVRQEVWDTLLGSDRGSDGIGADEASFRLTYPFSPAFMDTLVHVSSALQRNRTGMKLMGQLLADQRDELRLGDLIPVGDLYPLITSGGDKPFTDSLKVVFEAADKLYRTKLRPYLLATYNVTEEDVEQYTHRGPDNITDAELRGRVKTFVGDNRIVGPVVRHLLDEGFLDEDGGMLFIGPEAERRFGRRHFIELTASFTAPPQFTVFAGRTEIGQTDPSVLTEERPGPRRLLLAGRSWQVTFVDWARRRVFVEPADSGGVAKWTSGSILGLSYALTHSMREVLLGSDPPVSPSRRAEVCPAEWREGDAPDMVRPGGTLISRVGDDVRWWTWAGHRANATLAAALPSVTDPVQRPTDCCLRLREDVTYEMWCTARDGAAEDAALTLPDVDHRAVHGLEFSAALPRHLAVATVAARLSDFDGARAVLREPVELRAVR